MNVTMNNGFLIQDEFIFSSHSLNRKYYYDEGILKSVTITTRNISSKKIIDISEEKFSFRRIPSSV